MSTRSFVRRTVATVAGGAGVACGLMAVALVPSAHAASETRQVDAATAWLTAQLDSDGAFTYQDWEGNQSTDVGTTIDFALSLAFTNPDTPALATLKNGIDANLEAYVGETPTPGKSDDAAKAAFYYATVGNDAAQADALIARVESAVADTGDGSLFVGVNAYEQVWAALALDAAGADAADTADATTYLVDDLKCPGGGWGFGSGSDCAADPDTTALVVYALSQQQDVPGITAELTDAVTYLKGLQAADGSFANFGNPNANSTGMAGWALGVVHETVAAQKAATWVADHQIVNIAACGGGPVPGADGALALDDLAIKQAITQGIGAADQGGWIIAGAQALRSLAYLPATTTTATLTGPQGYVDAGSTISLKVGGLRPGQTACVKGAGATQWFVGPGIATMNVPAGTGEHQVNLTYPTGSAIVTLKALDATKLKIKVPASVKAKKKATIKVKGLAAGEPVTVKVGKKTATGTANAKGVAKVKVKVKKKGKAKVKVVGAFPDRKGKATTRVR